MNGEPEDVTNQDVEPAGEDPADGQAPRERAPDPVNAIAEVLQQLAMMGKTSRGAGDAAGGDA